LKPLRALLDTNVLISAFLFAGNERKVFRKGIKGEFTPLSSDYILTEFQTVLKNKLGVPESSVSSWVEMILEVCEIVRATKEYGIAVPHEKDREILNAGVDGNVDILVTGDRHLLQLALEKPKIVTAKEFLKILTLSNLDETKADA
jgi:putative PIN family toxin of toxin-antitoxin system